MDKQPDTASTLSLRQRIFDYLENTGYHEPTARWTSLFMIGLIAANVIAVILQSVPAIGETYASQFRHFEVFSVAVFSIEYLLRVWASPEHPSGRYKHPLFGRLRYMVTPMALIDLLAILPFFLSSWMDLRFARVFRLVRLLKLTRYFPAMGTLVAVLHEQRRALLSAMFVMLVLLTFSASTMYLIEKQAQPDAFGSIPAAMWWGIATLTTVGYGDVTPITTAGKIVGAFIALFGVGMFALPAAILASGFSRHTDRDKFVVSWKLIAGFPLFSNLNANDIADIAAMLLHRTSAPGELLFRPGQPSDAIYFIHSGEVQVRSHHQVFNMGPGDFFGELSLIENRPHSGSAVSLRTCRLLVLERSDFHHLCDEKPEIHQQMMNIAIQRNEMLSDLS